MTERATWPVRVAAPALLLVLAAAILVGPVAGLRLESPAGGPAGDVAGVLDALPDEAAVLVAFDPDLGTYAEVRPTVRTLLADLLARGANLAFASLTPEGRALALAEIERMRREGGDADRLADLGFVPGAEAGVVALARALAGASSGGIGPWPVEPLAETPALVLIVGGNDLGPRTWVEQFGPRMADVPLIAVAPTVLLPEVRPYLASGQLAALLATPRDGAAYRATVELLGPEGLLQEETRPTELAIAIGLLAALAWIGSGLLSRATLVLRGNGAGESG